MKKVVRVFHAPIFIPELDKTVSHIALEGKVVFITDVRNEDQSLRHVFVAFDNEKELSIQAQHVIAIEYDKEYSLKNKTTCFKPQGTLTP